MGLFGTDADKERDAFVEQRVNTFATSVFDAAFDRLPQLIEELNEFARDRNLNAWHQASVQSKAASLIKLRLQALAHESEKRFNQFYSHGR